MRQPKTKPIKRKRLNKRLHRAVAKKICLPLLDNRCRATIPQLFQELVNRGGQIKGKLGEQHAFLDNDSNILAVVHTDTVQDCNHFAVAEITDETIIYNPKLDDRLGVYTILDLLPKLGINPDILLTENEEIGQTTAADFKSAKQYNWIIEFDRAGTDAVTYQYDFEAQVEEHFKIGQGLFSDISEMDHLNCMAFNIGVGYHDAHSRRAYMILEEYIDQIARFVRFHDNNADTHFPYKRIKSIFDWEEDEALYHCKKCAEYFYMEEIENMEENGIACCPVCNTILTVG